MARPLSEEKRDALLTAAAELVAALGTAASTAKIAKAAGVSEGTLFTYFPTKDDLLNALFVEIETNLAETVLAPYPASVDARERLRLIWCRVVEWGLAKPTWRKAMRQLKVSEHVTDASRRRCEARFRELREMVEEILSGHADPGFAAFYIDTALIGLADMVIDAIAASPKDHEIISEAGFTLFWNGTAGTA
ncbi:TetR family transcriptional regulator [Sphingomonas sp. IBVSS2]|nr:TetR family transcriptional regulator [Sphingomonas sp. IBVSS2]